MFWFATHTYTHKLSSARKQLMKAKFPGKCSECDEEIIPGKDIAKNSFGNWVHQHCSDSNTDLPQKGEFPHARFKNGSWLWGEIGSL